MTTNQSRAKKKLKFLNPDTDNKAENKYSSQILSKGKPAERLGRKASGLSPHKADRTAGLLDVCYKSAPSFGSGLFCWSGGRK